MILSISHFSAAQGFLSDEKKETLSGLFAPHVLSIFHAHLLDFEQYATKRTLPRFEEEIAVDWKELWNRVHDGMAELTKEPESQKTIELAKLLETFTLTEILTLLGQRFTPGSHKDNESFPPDTAALKTAVFQPHNAQITVGVRAWEKHVGRSVVPFWGEIEGTPKERYAYVRALVDHIFDTVHWWNIFEHYKHGRVYEIREKQGHGLRWTVSPITFLGFVEPFDAAIGKGESVTGS